MMVLADSVDSPAAPLQRGEAHVWYAWTEHCIDAGLLDYYRSLLNEAERARLRRFAFDHLKHEFLVTRALCRLTLSRYAPIAPTAWTFHENAYGRPEIDAVGAPSGLRFNLSNARSLVACVVTVDADAGVDVEETDRRGEMESKAEHYFAPSEVEALLALPRERQRRRFFEYWTLKESYIKARGMGLSIPLEQFAFALDGARIGIGFDAALDDVPEHWQFALHAPSDRHLLAVGVRRGADPEFRLRISEVVPRPGLPRIGLA